MRPLPTLALGGATATAAAVLGLTIAGVATTTAVVALDPLAPAAHAGELRPFGDCDALLAWFQERGLAEVGPYGWDGGMIAYAAAERTMAEGVPLATTGTAADARTSSATGTNTQEADVDEPDVAKTDGRNVLRLSDNGTLVVTNVRGAKPVEVARLPLGDSGMSAELLLVGDHVLVLGNDAGGSPRRFGAPTDLIAPNADYVARFGGTRIVDVDLSDPAAPKVVRSAGFDGRLVSARAYGDTVRLVTAKGRPDLRWTYPNDPGATGSGSRVTERQALVRNRALVRATTLDDWLPRVTADGQTRRLLDCDEVLHPTSESGTEGDELVTVTTFPADDLGNRSSVGLSADGQVVYSSADRLYVAATRWNQGSLPVPTLDDSGVAAPVRPPASSTDLHAFALDGPRTRYVASGTVPGVLRDRWSLDEADGVLRVAWNRQGTRGTSNGITTFTERDGVLTRIGEIGDLGVDEDLQSVRWLGDLAVLVTFRQVDPLYTVDLSDAARPRLLGVLKIPGYSGYLHPIGGDLVLGLGVDATNQGRRVGSQAAVFDIADPTHPVQVSRAGLGAQTDLTALADPRAFTWLPGTRTGLTPVADWNTGRSGLVALKVGPAGLLTSRELASDLEGWQTRALPLGDGRVAVVDRGVRVFDLG